MEEAGAGEAIIALSSRTGVLVGGGRSQAFLTKITFKFTCTMYALLTQRRSWTVWKSDSSQVWLEMGLKGKKKSRNAGSKNFHFPAADTRGSRWGDLN